MIIYNIEKDKYKVIIPFTNGDKDNYLKDSFDFFKRKFEEIICKCNIDRNLIVDIYEDLDYGIILIIEILEKDVFKTIIKLHYNCIFMYECDCFEFGRMFFYNKKFYKKIEDNKKNDSKIIYNSNEIIDKGIIIRR